MVRVSNVKAPRAVESKKVAVGVAKAKPAERRACDRWSLLAPPCQVPAPTPPASMHRIPWHQAASSRSWISVQKPVQVPEISSSTDENDVVVVRPKLMVFVKVTLDHHMVNEQP